MNKIIIIKNSCSYPGIPEQYEKNQKTIAKTAKYSI